MRIIITTEDKLHLREIPVRFTIDSHERRCEIRKTVKSRNKGPI